MFAHGAENFYLQEVADAGLWISSGHLNPRGPITDSRLLFVSCSAIIASSTFSFLEQFIFEIGRSRDLPDCRRDSKSIRD